jgi:hydrogenase maturation protease
VKRIICVGNRFEPSDSVGPLVHDLLAGRELPPDVELIDGGLAGLDLLRFVDGAERVVFVDAMDAIVRPARVVVLGLDEAAECIRQPYDHAGGLAYLLGALPHVCEVAVPEVIVVGVQTASDEADITAAAGVSVDLVINGIRERAFAPAAAAG